MSRALRDCCERDAQAAFSRKRGTGRIVSRSNVSQRGETLSLPAARKRPAMNATCLMTESQPVVPSDAQGKRRTAPRAHLTEMNTQRERLRGETRTLRLPQLSHHSPAPRRALPTSPPPSTHLPASSTPRSFPDERVGREVRVRG